MRAASLDNAKGTLQSQGALRLASGDIDNQSGRILADAGDLDVSAGNLNNRGGVLSSLHGTLTADLRGVLSNGYDQANNRQGGITQAQALDLKVQGASTTMAGGLRHRPATPWSPPAISTIATVASTPRGWSRSAVAISTTAATTMGRSPANASTSTSAVH